jgi:hypothetical protein
MQMRRPEALEAQGLEEVVGAETALEEPWGPSQGTGQSETCHS